MSALKTIHDAEILFYSRNGRYASLEELNNAGAIDLKILRQQNRAYKFEAWSNDKRYEAFATPIKYGRESKVSFFVDESGKIRYADKKGLEANANDALLE